MKQKLPFILMAFMLISTTSSAQKQFRNWSSTSASSLCTRGRILNVATFFEIPEDDTEGLSIEVTEATFERTPSSATENIPNQYYTIQDNYKLIVNHYGDYTITLRQAETSKYYAGYVILNYNYHSTNNLVVSNKEIDLSEAQNFVLDNVCISNIDESSKSFYGGTTCAAEPVVVRCISAKDLKGNDIYNAYYTLYGANYRTFSTTMEGVYTFSVHQEHTPIKVGADKEFTLTVVNHDFWPVPEGFSKSSSYVENTIATCPLTFGNDTYSTISGENDDIDYANVPENERIFTHYTKGTQPANGDATTIPTSGTFYKFESSKEGCLLTVGIKLEKRCKFYLLDHDKSAGTITSLKQYGSELETWNGANGTVNLFTKANHDYYFFSTDEPLGLYGFQYSENQEEYYESNGFLRK